MSNRYYFRPQISDRKFRLILRLFCLDIEAKKVAEFTDLNRVTINNIYNKLRERIALLCEQQSPFTNGEVELDESYFGARRVRGVRGWGAKGKIPVFGMLKRGDKVYTQIVKNCSASELLPIIKGKADTEAVIYSDGFKTYDGLVNYGLKSTIASSMAKMNLPMERTILMRSKTSGDFARSGFQSSEVYINTHSIYI